ncbi:MAG: hypothetical protein DMF77_13545 [Acidobacteria bacterium]|nr:MAG: hypothetical protein DMF77_13545 [Acidobacteriota bacterium]
MGQFAILGSRPRVTVTGPRDWPVSVSLAPKVRVRPLSRPDIRASWKTPRSIGKAVTFHCAATSKRPSASKGIGPVTSP